VSIAPKSKTDARLALKMSAEGALRLLNTHEREQFHAMYFMTIHRMMEWMIHSGGYPTHGRHDSMYAVDDVNRICMELMHDGRFDFTKMKTNLLFLNEPSPFALEDDEIENIKLFLNELVDRLKRDINDNKRTGFDKRFV
jgi:hypothetical protein